MKTLSLFLILSDLMKEYRFYRDHHDYRATKNKEGAARCEARINKYVRKYFPHDTSIIKQGYRFCLWGSRQYRLVFRKVGEPAYLIEASPCLVPQVKIEQYGPLVAESHLLQLQQILCTRQEVLV